MIIRCFWFFTNRTLDQVGGGKGLIAIFETEIIINRFSETLAGLCATF